MGAELLITGERTEGGESVGDVTAVRRAMEEAGIEVQSSEIAERPKTSVELDEDTARKVLRLVDALEDNDDVDAVHANFDMSAEVMEAVAG